MEHYKEKMFRELDIYFKEIGIEVERERGKSEKKKPINNHIHLRGNERRERGKKKIIRKETRALLHETYH